LAKEITAEQVAAAEENLRAVKETGDAEEKREAMQACDDLRTAFILQEEAAGRRTGMIAVSDNESEG
jgi:hypothetical protein